MGNDFSIYTYSSYPPYLSHIINTDKTYSPASLLPTGFYISCHPIHSLPVFSRRSIPSFSFPFLTPSAILSRFPSCPRCGGIAFRSRHAFRLASRRGVSSCGPFCSVPLSVVSSRGAAHRFCQLVFVGSSCLAVGCVPTVGVMSSVSSAVSS